MERERRQVTLLFADVVGFTPISERFDQGIVHEMMDGCLARLTRKVERYAGRVNAFTGDGVMALFGAPLLKRATPSAATPGGVLAGESTYRVAGEAFSRPPVKANKP